MSETSEVRRTLHAYCSLLDDRRLEDLVGTVYTEDAVDDRQRGEPLHGRAQIHAYFERALGHVRATAHILTNVDIDIVTPSRIALATSRVTAYHWNVGESGAAADFVLLGTYTDRLVRGESGWMIENRVVAALGPAGLAVGGVTAGVRRLRRPNMSRSDDDVSETPSTGGPGPLSGIKVLDVSSLGPGPFCSMLLCDYGADVVSVERPHRETFDPSAYFSRGKRSIIVDLRAPGGADVIRRLASTVDVFLEGYRPGTMERRGLGPDVLLGDNPRLVYARLTGYGQHGPYAQRAGHDINYIAAAGALGAIGTDYPVPPLNILGDFAGGSLNAALGIILALFERARTGVGQVVDAAMIDGAALLLTAQLAEHSAQRWSGRGTSVLSGAAPFYGVYRCSDGAWFAVGAIEQRFYDQMLGALGLVDTDLPSRDDPDQWEQLRTRIADVFRTEPRAHWEKQFADIDGCGSPVLDIDELTDDPHLVQRGTIANDADGGLQAGIAPRLSGSDPALGARVKAPGCHTAEVLAERGFNPTEIADLAARGVITCPTG